MLNPRLGFPDISREWIKNRLLEISRLPKNCGFVTGEYIRVSIMDEIGRPKHHNSWGALIKLAKEKGLISSTGSFRHMQTRKSHGRFTPEYKLE